MPYKVIMWMEYNSTLINLIHIHTSMVDRWDPSRLFPSRRKMFAWPSNGAAIIMQFCVRRHVRIADSASQLRKRGLWWYCSFLSWNTKGHCKTWDEYVVDTQYCAMMVQDTVRRGGPRSVSVQGMIDEPHWHIIIASRTPMRYQW